MSRDTHTHTHTHTPWSELCEDNGGSSVINTSITQSALHRLSAVLLAVCVSPSLGVHSPSSVLCLWPISVSHSAFTHSDVNRLLSSHSGAVGVFSTQNAIYISA